MAIDDGARGEDRLLSSDDAAGGRFGRAKQETGRVQRVGHETQAAGAETKIHLSTQKMRDRAVLAGCTQNAGARAGVVRGGDTIVRSYEEAACGSTEGRGVASARCSVGSRGVGFNPGGRRAWSVAPGRSATTR